MRETYSIPTMLSRSCAPRRIHVGGYIYLLCPPAPDCPLAQDEFNLVLLDSRRDQLYDQLDSCHAAELCFKREPTDHVVRERYFPRPLLAFVMHRDLKIHRRRTLNAGLLLTAGKLMFLHVVLCQCVILYICESRDRPRVRACLFRGCRVLHTYSPTPQNTSSSIIPRGPKTDSKFRASYLERSGRDADDIRDFLFCCSTLDQIGDLANVLRCEFCPFYHGLVRCRSH